MKNKFVAPLLSVASVIAATVGVVPVASAAYTPVPGARFADPRDVNGTTPYPRQGIRQDLINKIVNSPAGSTIRFTSLGIDLPDVTNALVAAHDRGVNVRIIVPVEANTAEVVQLRSELGSNRSGTSYLVTCNNGCHSNFDAATMHAKIYLFSATGTATEVATTSSFNLTGVGVNGNWNDSYTFVGNSAAYVALRNYFESMRLDQTQPVPDHSVGVGSGNVVLTYPEPNYSINTDVYRYMLQQTSCTGANSANDVGGRTLIQVATYYWRDNRADFVEALGNKVDAGCYVQVVVSEQNTDPGIIAKLKAEGISARYSNAADGSPYSHSKFMLISGVYGGNATIDTMMTGSLNLTSTDGQYSDNQVIRFGDNGTLVTNYKNFFNTIFNQSTRI